MDYSSRTHDSVDEGVVKQYAWNDDAEKIRIRSLFHGLILLMLGWLKPYSIIFKIQSQEMQAIPEI